MIEAASYKQHPKLDDRYDVICIGSGLGSMTAANLLARQEKKVLVLEKHYTPGGFTHVFKRPDYEWDVGVHYVGDAHREGTLMNVLFRFLTDDNLSWADMGDVYDRIVFGDKTYDFVKGNTPFREQMKHYFPQEAGAIDRYVDLLFEVNKTGQSYYTEKVMPDIVRFFLSDRMRRPYMEYASRTTWDVLSGLTSNKELIGVLTGQYGDYGLPPRQSSFVMHVAVAKHYLLNGGCYPVKGSAEIFRTIAPAIYEAGGQVLTNAAVSRVKITGKRADGVLMADGRYIPADVVISGAGVGTTFNRLIAQEDLGKFPVAEYRAIPPSTSHFCLYIGLKKSGRELGLPKANFWLYPDHYDHDENITRYLADIGKTPLPVAYVSFPSAKDPDWEQRFPGKSTIEVITLGPYDSVTAWEGTRWKKRGQDYEEFKEKMSRRMLERLFDVMPHLRQHIDYYELSTPLSTRHFANYEHGEIYGIDHTPARFALKSLRPKTPVKGFYLTGQDILSVGIAGAAMSGVLTASAILRRNMLQEILKMR